MGPQMDCNDCWQVGVQDKTIELSPEDIDFYRSISEASRMQGQLQEHMRTAPISTGDHAALRAHLESPGHWEPMHPDATLEELQAVHDEHHSTMDSGPEDEREPHTTMGDQHFHHPYEG
jgi:hypothetical protein